MTEGSDWNPPPEVRRLKRLLEQAMRRAQRTILNPPGRTDAARAWHASQAAQKVKALRDELRRLGVEVDAVTGKVIRDAYRQGRQYAEQHLQQAGVVKPPIAGSFAAVETRRAETFIRSAGRDLHRAINSMGDVTERVVRQTHAIGRKLGAPAIRGEGQ